MPGLLLEALQHKAPLESEGKRGALCISGSRMGPPPPSSTNDTYSRTRTVCGCSEPACWSIETEKPLLPSEQAGMDTRVTVCGIRVPGDSGSSWSITGVTTVW